MCMFPPQMIWYVSTQTVPSCGATEGFRRVVRLDTRAVHANCPLKAICLMSSSPPCPRPLPHVALFGHYISMTFVDIHFDVVLINIVICLILLVHYFNEQVHFLLWTRLLLTHYYFLLSSETSIKYPFIPLCFKRLICVSLIIFKTSNVVGFPSDSVCVEFFLI